MLDVEIEKACLRLMTCWLNRWSDREEGKLLANWLLDTADFISKFYSALTCSSQSSVH